MAIIEIEANKLLNLLKKDPNVEIEHKANLFHKVKNVSVVQWSGSVKIVCYSGIILAKQPLERIRINTKQVIEEKKEVKEIVIEPVIESIQEVKAIEPEIPVIELTQVQEVIQEIEPATEQADVTEEKPGLLTRIKNFFTGK